MAEYEKGRNRYESDRIKKLKEIELAKGQQFVPRSGAVPASAQFTTQSRPAPIVQNTQQGSNLRTAAASAGVSQQQNNIVINTEETTAGGIGIYKNVPFTDDSGKPYTKIFDSVLVENELSELRINNVLQLQPVHYHDKKFKVKELIQEYEKYMG